MTTTKWAHLPNAVHIDRMIALAKSRPKQCTQRRQVCASWSVARTASRDAICSQGRLAAWDAAGSVAWSAAWDAERDVVWDVVWDTREAISALLAYDDCAYMLDSDPGELAILAKFGDPRAVLLLPVCKALHSLT